MAKCVLVVDDDLDHQDICVTILRHHGYRVLLGMDGEEGLRLAQEQHPDLVLMDGMLPVLDGWHATERLKSSPQTAHIPVVMITARALESDRERSLKAGADSYLAKPCEPSQVVAEVQRLIGPSKPS